MFAFLKKSVARQDAMRTNQCFGDPSWASMPERLVQRAATATTVGITVVRLPEDFPRNPHAEMSVGYGSGPDWVDA